MKMKTIAMAGSLVLCVLLFGCAAGGPSVAPSLESTSNTGAIAVWNLEDVSPPGAAQPDLADFLSARVLETVKAMGQTVVEREKLLSVLNELSLGSSRLADAETQLSIGRMAGAKRMIFGGYQVIGGSMRIDLRMVDVETGKVMSASEKTIETMDLTSRLAAAEEASRKLLNK